MSDQDKQHDHDHDDDHSHGHDHDHQHGPECDHDDPFHVHPTRELDIEQFDPANRSLAEALRISFGILKGVVIILLIVFVVVGGYRKVEEGQVGIRVRFGAVQGERLDNGGFVPEVLEPGPHFALPEPIDQVIIVPTKAQLAVIDRIDFEQLDIETGELVEVTDTAFWFEETPQEAVMPLEDKPVKPGGLKPGRDGSLLTADQNIVHGKWTVEYHVPAELAPQFAVNVGATDIKESLARAERMVIAAAQRAIVHVVARTTVDDFVLSKIDRQAIRELTERMLEQMSAGIKVSNVWFDVATPPISTRAAFNTVTDALSQRSSAIASAQREREQILTEAAGAGWRKLSEAIDAYELARLTHAANSTQARAAEQAIQQMLRDPATLAENGISGEVADLIQNAESDRTNLKTQIESEANAFISQYRKYTNAQGVRDEALRKIIIQRLWQDTVEEVFGSAGEVFWLPRGTDELYIEFGPNPAIRKATETGRRAERLSRDGG